MLVQIVRFKTDLSEAAFAEVAEARMPDFEKVPGLLQKYFVRFDAEGTFGGVYLWESREAMQTYRQSDLAQGVGAAYHIIGETEIDTANVVLPLRTLDFK